MLNTISNFIFRKKYHRISNVRLDTLKNTRYGYQMEHWLLMRFAFLGSAGTSYNGCLLLTGRTMKWKQKVENKEFSDTSTYHLFRLENLRGIYYVHWFIALLLVLVCRHTPQEFSIEHGMKLKSDTDMGISFFNKSMDLAVTLQGEELDQCFTNTDLILVQ